MEPFYIDRTLYDCPKSDCTEKESLCYDTLSSLGIGFSRVDHEAIPTIEGCLEVAKVLGANICKNLFLCNAQKTDFYLVMMPGEKSFKTKLLSPQLGCSRLSFAPSEFMEELIGCTPGSASALGLIFDKKLRVRLVIDKALLEEELIGCHPCLNTSTLKLRTKDLLNIYIPHTNHTPTFVEL